jgi:O-antigen ligase
MPDRWYRVLSGAAAAYLALLPTNALAFWRSATMALAVLAALAVGARAWRARSLGPAPGAVLVAAFAAWALWSCASALWSVDPRHTLSALRGDLLASTLTFALCYVAAAARPEGSRLLGGTLLGGLAFWTALAAGFALSAIAWSPTLVHWAPGVYTTWLVTVVPLLLLLLWPAPAGFGDGARAAAVAALVFALAIGTARFADARAVWVAFGASLAVGGACALASGSRLRAVPVAVALIAIALFAVLLADAAIEKAVTVYPAGTSVAHTVAVDPRPTIWRGALAAASERPLTGHGFGLQVLAERMSKVSSDPRITHPHNLFLGQLVQTGAIGLALFVLTIGALAAHHWRLVRAGDEVLARLGTIGLMVLAGFVVRNLTDDFFLRANAKLVFAVQGVLLGAAALRRRRLAGKV